MHHSPLSKGFNRMSKGLSRAPYTWLKRLMQIMKINLRAWITRNNNYLSMIQVRKARTNLNCRRESGSWCCSNKGLTSKHTCLIRSIRTSRNSRTKYRSCLHAREHLQDLSQLSQTCLMLHWSCSTVPLWHWRTVIISTFIFLKFSPDLWPQSKERRIIRKTKICTRSHWETPLTVTLSTTWPWLNNWSIICSARTRTRQRKHSQETLTASRLCCPAWGSAVKMSLCSITKDSKDYTRLCPLKNRKWRKRYLDLKTKSRERPA